MREIAGPGNVSGQFVDYDPVNNPLGTVYTADWGNDVQNDLLAIQTDAGVAEASGASANVLKSIIKITKMYSRELGEPFFNWELKSPTAFDATSVATAKTYFPAICLDTIDIQTTLSATNWPDLVPWLRARQIKYREGRSDEVASFPSSVSGSNVTLDNTTANNRLLAALAKWVLVHGSYTNWLTITDSAGTEFPITNINVSTRVIAVTGSPAASSTITIYPHRIAGSTTTARLHEVSGKSIIAANDAAGLFINGMLIMGEFQGFGMLGQRLNDASAISGNQLTSTAGISPGNPSGGTTSTVVSIITDGTNGTPRTASDTHGAGTIMHLYLHGQRYVA